MSSKFGNDLRVEFNGASCLRPSTLPKNFHKVLFLDGCEKNIENSYNVESLCRVELNETTDLINVLVLNFSEPVSS